jgi:D-alanine-D-alanine ligase
MDTGMNPRRVLVLMHPDLIPPASLKGQTPQQINVWKTEYDVVSTLRRLGHTVRLLGVQDDVLPIRAAIHSWHPHIVFNLLEEFHGDAQYDHHIVSYLELLQVAYTGNNPRGLVISRDKALAKKILRYHGIRVPEFAVVTKGKRARLPAPLTFPVIVKSLVEHASLGISRASVVKTQRALERRVSYVHDQLETDAIIEEYVEGRELYVGVIGNSRPQVLPVWELLFENLPPNMPRIATEKIKHDTDVQARWGIYQHPVEDLSPALVKKIQRACRQIYQALELEGYARIDFRLRADGAFFFLEANPNPEIARREEFASSAAFAGTSYPKLLQKILGLGLRRHRG